MTRNRFLLGCILALIGASPLRAQDIENSKLEREARWQVYKSIAELENNSPLSSGFMSDRFMNLFDVNATHIVDFPMWNNVGGEAASIETYVDTYENLFKRGRKFRLTLLSMDFSREGERFEVVTTVRKEFVGRTSEFGWEFDRDEFHQYLTIVWTCEDISALTEFWDKQKRLRSSRRRKPQLPFLIEEIRWADEQSTTYVALVDESKVEAEIECGGVSLPGPSDKLAIYLNNNPTWILRDGNGTFADNKFEAEHFSLEDSIVDILSPRSLVQTGESMPWHFTVFGGASQFTIGGLASGLHETSSIRSSVGWNIGGSLGYSPERFRQHGQVLDTYLSANLTSRSFSIEIAKLQFSFPAIDPDDFSYVRQISGQNWSEQVSEQALSLGLGGRYLKRFRGANSDQQWLVGGAIEASYSLASQTTYSSSTGVTYSGFYDDLYGITIDQNGIYDFGTFMVSGSGSTSWRHAFSVPMRVVVGLKKNKLNPLTLLLSSGPAFHFRRGQAVAQEEFLLSDELTSIVHQSDLFRFATLDFQVGIRQRLGWKSLECETN